MKETICDCCGKKFTKGSEDIFGEMDVIVVYGEWTRQETYSYPWIRKVDRFKSKNVCGECAEKIMNFIKQLKK